MYNQRKYRFCITNHTRHKSIHKTKDLAYPKKEENEVVSFKWFICYRTLKYNYFLLEIQFCMCILKELLAFKYFRQIWY